MLEAKGSISPRRSDAPSHPPNWINNWEEMANFRRFPVMPAKKSPDRNAGKKGNFGDQREGLLTLFDNSEGQGQGNWRETFGFERRPAKPKRGKPFIAGGARRSSSDSK